MGGNYWLIGNSGPNMTGGLFEAEDEEACPQEEGVGWGVGVPTYRQALLQRPGCHATHTHTHAKMSGNPT